MLIAASLAILLLSALAGIHLGGSVFAQSVEAVTIKADGTVEPTTSPIIKVGDIYTLTENIQGSITVEKSNITLNGAGHTIEQVVLDRVEGVIDGNFTVTNAAAPSSQSDYGIVLNSAVNCIIENNTVLQKKYGIASWGSSYLMRIAGNNVTGNQYGIHVEGYNYTIIGNSISANNLGIYLYYGFNSTVFGNQIAENGIGMRFFVGFYGHSGDGNLIYSNNFVNNSRNVENVGPLFALAIGPMNCWDSGKAGNYWSDYKGFDADGDGIGDTPYVIDDLNQDDFPLMAPLMLPELPGAPYINLLSPGNETYAVAEVALNFTVSKRVVWMGYSLDGKDNVTVAGNITLAVLSDGMHTVTVFANDTFGFTGTSETVTFTVATFPTTSIILIVISTVAVVACLLIYFKKRKR